MNRFEEKKSIFKRINMSFVSLIIFIGLFVIFFFAVNNLSSDTMDRKEESLKNAVNRGIVSCYALEGTYPPGLDYLKEHYGLTYDEDLFFVDYQAIGSNIFPDVTIIRREGK